MTCFLTKPIDEMKQHAIYITILPVVTLCFMAGLELHFEKLFLMNQNVTDIVTIRGGIEAVITKRRCDKS